MIRLDNKNDTFHHGVYNLLNVKEDGECVIRDASSMMYIIDKACNYNVHTVVHLGTKCSLSEFIEDYEKDLEMLKKFREAVIIAVRNKRSV